MSTCIAPKVAADAPPSEKMERKCRQAWEAQFHHVKRVSSYDDWRTVWFACLERVGINSDDPETSSYFDDANGALDSLEIHFPSLEDSYNFAMVREFFAKVFE